MFLYHYQFWKCETTRSKFVSTFRWK